MRHRLRGRQLSRDTEHRKALRRNLVQSLFEHGRVKTTLPKAKEVQAFAEKLITLVKKAAAAPDDEKGRAFKLACRRRAIARLQDRRLVDDEQEFITEGSRTVIQKLFNDIAGKIDEKHKGGYTRIVKLSKWRIGDGGDLVQLELVSETEKPRGTANKPAGLRRKRAERKRAFAKKALKEVAASN